MLIARSVRSTRRAISPRLATRTLRMRGTGALFTGFDGRLEEEPSCAPRLASRLGSCYQNGSDARGTSILRRGQSPIRHQDAPGAAEPDPRPLDLHPPAPLPPPYARGRGAPAPARGRAYLRARGGGAAGSPRFRARDPRRGAHRHRPLVPPLPTPRLAGHAGGALPLRARAGDSRSPEAVGR